MKAQPGHLPHRQETQLHPLDSVALAPQEAPQEARQWFNPSPHEARVLLAMPMAIRHGDAPLNSTFRLVEMIMGHQICSDPQPLIHWRAG